MKLTKFQVRWDYIDWLSEPPLSGFSDAPLRSGSSEQFVSLEAHKALDAARRLYTEIDQSRHAWDDLHDIEVFNLRIVKITEEVVG